MIEYYPNEIVMLLLGVGVLIFILKNRIGLKRLPYYEILMTAFSLLLVSWFATVVEGLIASLLWNTFFNILEHAGLAASSVLTAMWCWKTFTGKRKEG